MKGPTMDYGFFKAFEELKADVAAIKGDISAMKDLQAKINIAYDKTQSIEDRARVAVGQAPPAK